MQMSALEGGFPQPAIHSARAFRGVMNAMASPGRIERLEGAAPPFPLSVAAGTVLLTLCDADTPLHLAGGADCPAVRDWVAFHTGAPIAAPETCTFALGTWEALVPLSVYAVGTPEYPDRSATLIVDMPALEPAGSTLRGPGISGVAQLSLPETRAFQWNRTLFPLGLDFLFTCGDRVAALPRSTEVS